MFFVSSDAFPSFHISADIENFNFQSNGIIKYIFIPVTVFVIEAKLSDSQEKCMQQQHVISEQEFNIDGLENYAKEVKPNG